MNRIAAALIALLIAGPAWAQFQGPPAPYMGSTAGGLGTGGSCAITIGSTTIACGGTATTVTGLTLSGGTLSGTTTLPGSGQISSAGALGIGAAPTFSFFRVGGTYITANPDMARYDGTLQSSSTSNHSGTTYSNIFEPQGASVAGILNLNVGPTLGTFALNVPTVVNYYSLIVQSAGYSGVISEANNFRGSTLLNSNGTPATTFRSFRQNTITNGTSLASGTVTNVAFYAQGITSSAAGGTLNNRSMELTVPSGGASSGTANNRGLYITGNGGTASGGTVNNYAIYNDSTAQVYLSAGQVGIKQSTPQADLHIGTTTGTARIYNAFTDASNGEWAYLGSWAPTANVATFGTDKNGSGSTRNIQFYVGGTSKLNYGITTAATWTLADALALTTLGSDATHTDATVCRDTTTGLLLAGSGTVGICLGTSSMRFKHDIAPDRDGLAAVMALKPVTFRYNKGHVDDGKTIKYGFLAEDVADVLPKLVGFDPDGQPNSVDMVGVVPVMVRAIQELKSEVDQLRAK